MSTICKCLVENFIKILLDGKTTSVFSINLCSPTILITNCRILITSFNFF